MVNIIEIASEPALGAALGVKGHADSQADILGAGSRVSKMPFAEVDQLMRPKRNRTHVDALIRHYRPFFGRYR
jgi:hypothetical protein